MMINSRQYEDDGKRIRNGLTVLLVGLVVVVVALGLAALRAPMFAGGGVEVADQHDVGGTAGSLPAPIAVALMVILAALLLLILAAGYTLFRITRRHTVLGKEQRAVPTPTSDVWQMHKLPQEQLADEPGGPGEDNS